MTSCWKQEASDRCSGTLYLNDSLDYVMKFQALNLVYTSVKSSVKCRTDFFKSAYVIKIGLMVAIRFMVDFTLVKKNLKKVYFCLSFYTWIFRKNIF